VQEPVEYTYEKSQNKGCARAHGHTNIIRDNSLSKDVSQYIFGDSPISIVMTNPPFGSREKVIDKNVLKHYELGYVWDDYLNRTDQLRKSGQTQGTLFLERCYHFLKEDGIIGIVLPDGIYSNLNDDYIRKWIVTHFQVLAVISLPEETFRVESIGVNVKTSVLVAKKRKGLTKHNIFFALPKTIGYDMQGEKTASNEVLDVPKYYYGEIEGIREKYFKINLNNDELINRMDAQFYSYQINMDNSFPLEKYCDIFVGKTPNKANYLNKGKIKILKVRCLTNKMIDWSDKKRDYVTEKWYKKREKETIDIHKYDIILASAAHVAKYIGDEIDIVDTIPIDYSDVIASAKIIVIRVKNITEINPYVLLLYLRTEECYKQIQSIIRGQTAEIYSCDLNKFRIPISLVELSKRDGTEIQRMYELSLQKIKDGEKKLETIQNKYDLKIHSNIQHS